MLSFVAYFLLITECGQVVTHSEGMLSHHPIPGIFGLRLDQRSLHPFGICKLIQDLSRK